MRKLLQKSNDTMKDICNLLQSFTKLWYISLMYVQKSTVLCKEFEKLKSDQIMFVPRIIFPWLAIVMGYNREFIVVSKGRSKMMLY